MIKYVKDILVYKSSNKLELYNEEELKKIEEISKEVSKERLIDLIYKLSELENDIKWSTQKTIMLQAGIINLCNQTKQVENVVNIQQNNTVQKSNNVQFTNNQISNNINLQDRKVNKKINETKKTFSKNPDEYWPQIVNDLKQSGKIVLYTNLMSTKAKEINDMTVGIEFPKGITSFGKAILEKQDNIREITKLVSMAYGKEMHIKYIVPNKNMQKLSAEQNLQNLANEADVPFNIVD